MKLIRTEDAVGHVLCHDMTQRFGSDQRCEIPEGTYCHRRRYSVLLSIGKEHLYVWEKTEACS